MSLSYRSIGSSESVYTMSKKTEEFMKKQLEMSEKLLCAFVKNQSPDLEGGSNMNNMMQMMNTITDTRNKDIQNKIFIENIRQNQNMLSLNMGSLVGGVIDHNHLEFDYEGAPQIMSYKFPKDATSLTLSIINESGIPVFNTELNRYETEFVWDGLMQNGQKAPQGLYKISVNGLDAARERLKDLDCVWLRSPVTHIVFDDDMPVLMSNDQPIGDIRSYQKKIQDQNYFSHINISE